MMPSSTSFILGCWCLGFLFVVFVVLFVVVVFVLFLFFLFV